MTSVAIYARQSEDVAEGITRQLARCRALVDARRWTVSHEYKDNDTSAAKKRGAGTAWAAMLADIEAGRIDVVVAVDLDRLLRDTRDLMVLIDSGAKVLTVDGEIDLTTADGEFRATMLAGIARFEVRRKSERQLRANADRAAKGEPNPGRRRYGYETDGITPREAEAVVVRRLFDHVASGGSLRSAVRWLTDEQVDPAPGKVWDTRRLRELLSNQHYAGYVKHKGQVFKSDVVVPVVDEELAADVRAILSDPSRKTTPGTKPKHLLSGVVHCGVCGARMWYTRLYTCRENTRHPQITKDRLEPVVRDEIATAFISGGPDLFPVSPGAAHVRELTAAHDRNAQAVAATIEDRDEGLIPPAMARTRLIELRDARLAIEAELDRARTEKSASSALADIAQELLVDSVVPMSEFVSMKERVLARFDELDIDRRREIVRALVHVEVLKGKDERGQPIPPRRRVVVEHKLALHLNPDAETDIAV